MPPAPQVAQALEWLSTGETARARQELESLISSEPASALLHNALGAALAASGERARAAASFEAALALDSDHVGARTNLASAYLEDGRIIDAVVNFERALSSGRAPPQAAVGLGQARALLGKHSEALQAFEQAAGHPKAHARVHSQRCYASLLDPGLDAASVVSLHREYEARLQGIPDASTSREARRPLGHKCVIGYVSGDLREHSVASFLEPVLRSHDRSSFEIVAFSDSRREDATTARLRQLFGRFHEIAALGDEQVVELVRNDGVDVLVDLAGHTQPNRLRVFAHRPAPVSFTYLGYPGTTGMSVFDGRITDHWADPDDDAELVGPEPLVRVEGGLFAFAPPADVPAVSAPPLLTNGFPTLGCMGDVLKLNDAVLETWAKVLLRVPNARLLLKTRLLSSADVRHRILAKLHEASIGEDRVTLLPATSTRREHLETYSRIDLALDTFPYAGATTTCEALTMGVPVVTLAGDRHSHRLGVSILGALDLDELTARNSDEYLGKAADLARDPDRLAHFRRTLRSRLVASPLFDGARVAKAIERAANERLAALRA